MSEREVLERACGVPAGSSTVVDLRAMEAEAIAELAVVSLLEELSPEGAERVLRTALDHVLAAAAMARMAEAMAKAGELRPDGYVFEMRAPATDAHPPTNSAIAARREVIFRLAASGMRPIEISERPEVAATAAVVSLTLGELVAAGRLRRVGRGQYAPVEGGGNSHG